MEEKQWSFIPVDKLFFCFIHIITLGTGEEVDEVAGGASSMSVDRIGEVGDRTCEG